VITLGTDHSPVRINGFGAEIDMDKSALHCVFPFHQKFTFAITLRSETTNNYQLCCKNINFITS
jgi:hypothetical protein